MTFELIRTIGIVLGVILSIPAMIALVKLTLFIGNMQSTVAATARSLEAFMTKIEAHLDEQALQLGEHEVKLAILMDGHERRTGTDRRQNG